MKRSTWASAADTFLPARSDFAWPAPGTDRAGSLSPIVTCRSCMASSSALCTLGGARLISSASTGWRRSGPRLEWPRSARRSACRQVGGQEIGRELNAAELESERLRERGDGQRLAEPRTLDQQAPASTSGASACARSGGAGRRGRARPRRRSAGAARPLQRLGRSAAPRGASSLDSVISCRSDCPELVLCATPPRAPALGESGDLVRARVHRQHAERAPGLRLERLDGAAPDQPALVLDGRDQHRDGERDRSGRPARSHRRRATPRRRAAHGWTPGRFSYSEMKL